MRRILINNAISRRVRRSQRGQSIILLAFAFIALIAFVGLVTDIALLFVRYASLRRAVDSAAIAAAGQVRESTTYAEVAVAAQQYIELHGLESDSILVETCETDIYKWRLGLDPYTEPHPEAAFSPVKKHMKETELCDWDDPHKLVRVSAQIKSPTTFLSLIGIKTFTLEATSVSETAVIDIALVIDTSESMAEETNGGALQAVGMIPATGPVADGSLYFPERCTKINPVNGDDNFEWAGCCNDPGEGYVGDGRTQTNGIVAPNGLIWHDTNGNSMYDGAGENGVANNKLTSSWSSGTDEAYNFTTLVCQPFKQVKDAARAFVRQLDFVRGDRIVFATFDRAGTAYDPDGDEELRPLIRDELTAIETLNRKVGIFYNTSGFTNFCDRWYHYWLEWDEWIDAGSNPGTRPQIRPQAYETIASCGQTNVGGGILAANNALTDPVDVRREAVWVIVVLSDGAANVTNPANGIPPDEITYGSWGYCPWRTFCSNADPDYVFAECPQSTPDEPKLPYCNDNDPKTRHFCLSWETGEQTSSPECTVIGNYDADDYARDMADFAGLIEVADGIPGNYMAMFSIAFGEEIATEKTGAPLLRYIADAGDNGFIDTNLEQDWRDDGFRNYPDGVSYPEEFGEPGPCEGITNPKQQCGQYYYAEDLATLTDVFEEIAGRLFTRLSR